MQKITVRLVKVVKDNTRTENPKPYQVLQVVAGEQGLINQLSGEVLSVAPANMDGAECQALKIMGNGGKYMKTYKVVDFDLSRKYQPGKQIELYAIPQVKIKDGAPVIVYIATDDQEAPKTEPTGELYLLPVKDYAAVTDFKPGKITIPVALRPWASNNKKGINYQLETV